MLLFIVLFTVLLLLVAFTAFMIAVGGAAFIVVFADVIVCVFILVWIIKRLSGKKKKKAKK